MRNDVIKLYFDTEFTGLRKDADLISIGIVDSCEKRMFYAEFTDYDRTKLDGWIKKNVIDNLLHPEKVVDSGEEKLTTITGTKEEVRKHLLKWLSIYQVYNCTVQFVTDVGHYDFVLLIDLLTGGKTAMDLPEFIIPCIFDINQEIARFTYENFYSNVASISMEEAFNINREELLTELLFINDAYFDDEREEIKSVLKENRKHNSLYDAKVIAIIEQRLYELD